MKFYIEIVSRISKNGLCESSINQADYLIIYLKDEPALRVSVGGDEDDLLIIEPAESSFKELSHVYSSPDSDGFALEDKKL